LRTRRHGNRIKECQLDLFADRTSAKTMRANQLRLWFAAMAYVLVCPRARIASPTTRPGCGPARSLPFRALPVRPLPIRNRYEKSALDNREAIEARLTSSIELQNMVLTDLVATYLARRQSLGCHPDPTCPSAPARCN
jgi:hypothetical protein